MGRTGWVRSGVCLQVRGESSFSSGLISRTFLVGWVLSLQSTWKQGLAIKPSFLAARDSSDTRCGLQVPPKPLRLLPTCLLSLASGGCAPWPIPRSIEGCYADHVGCVACQVLELHTVLSQEKRLHPLREVSPLDFPEINLWGPQRSWE